MTYTDKELKLLRLMMNSGAAKGEIDNAATMLAQSLRGRGVSFEDIEIAMKAPGGGAGGLAVPKPPKYTRPDYGLIACPFRKHKGEMASDIDPSYLRYMITWIREHTDPEIQKKFGPWADDMESFLDQ